MKKFVPAAGLVLATAAPLCAQAVFKGDSGNSAWILASAALVLLMTVPGLALFYGGMVRRKNLLSTFYYSFASAIVVCALWVLGLYSISFGSDAGGLVGWSPGKMLLAEVGVGAAGPNGLPETVFLAYQMMFAVITVALVSGALVERLSFKAWLAFTALWSVIVYGPLAHWVWGGGWLSSVGGLLGLEWNGKPLGVLDYAGGLVVHVSSGVAALVAVRYVGPRKGFEREPPLPGSVSMTFLGAGLLWFGWFGFNAGSALGADGAAGNAFLTTNTAAVFAAIAWVAAEWLTVGKPSLIGGASGLVAGLATITPAAGFVDARAAILIGVVAGLAAWLFVTRVKKALRYDDSLDVFNIHGVGGTIGLLLAGVLANPAVGGAAGLAYGNGGQLLVQFIGVAVGYGFSALATWLILVFIDKVLRLSPRVEPAEEAAGLDFALHGERESNEEA